MSQPSQVRPSSTSRSAGSAGTGDRQFPFTPPAVQAWLARHAQEPAEERRSLRLRLAVVEHDLGRGLDLDGRDDFRCLARRGLEPSEAVVAQALALLRDLGPRALCCDEDGDGGRFARASAAAELIERGQCDSLLVICPERDCADWIERLQQGFGLPARLCTEERISDLAGGGAWVMTHATAVARAQQVHDRGFGAVLLDEIHACGRDAVRALRHALREQMFLFARTSSPLHEGFTTLYRALDLVRGPVAHPLGTWEEFVSLFLGGDATAQFPRKGTEDELRARLSAWMHRDARAEGGDVVKSKTKRAVKEHLLEPQQREKEYLELAWRAALGFPEGTRGHYLAAAIGGPWAFAEAVERAIARNLVAEPALRRVLQDLVVRGRSMRETAKTAQLAQIARKVQKDRDARVLVCVRSGATATGISHALAQAGFMDQTEVLKEGQDGLNRMAIQRFVLGERRILIAPDGAARGIVVHCVTDLVHFGPALEPAEHVARLERLGSEDGARCTVHRLILRGTPEESAVHLAQQRLGFHDLEAEQVGTWLGDLGLGASADGWSRFLLGRVAATLEGKSRDEELLPLLEQRKQAEAFRSDRRRAADRVLGTLGRTQRTARARYESDAPRHTVAQLVAASLELRQGGWQVTDDKRILLEHEGRHSELRVPERSGRTLSQPPTEDTKILDCEPGSWAWERLTAKFREGSSFFLADARAYPLDRVRKKLAAKLEPHGLVIESLNVAESHETVAASLNLRATAHAGPERHEALIEARSCAEGHQLDAYLDAPETLPWPDGSRTPMIAALEGAVAEAVEEAFARASDEVETLVRSRSDLTAFLGAAAARPASARPAPEFGVGASVEGLTGLLYQTVTVEARVRHRDQTAAWPIRVRCVPVSGVILGEIPLPADAAPGAPLWACAAGHLVAAGAIHACATPGCTTGLCAEHAGADAGLHKCEDCGSARCSEHSSACAGCGSALCAEHLEELDSGSRACGKCAQTLEDGRRYLADEIAWSAVSRRAGPKSELERSALSGRWGFPAEMVTCEVSGRRLLPDEVANCARSHKRVARDLLFQDPISGLLCQDEYFVPSCVSNARALPESMVRSAVSGRLALPEEIRACSCCDARILPDEGAECPETGAFACPRHMRRCAESGAMTLPEGLGRCQISGAEVRHGLLRICAETGKRARPQFFETCASSSASVLPDGMETCAATGRRVRRSLLQTCAVTGQKVMPEHLGTCSVSGRRVVKDLLVACAETGVLMTKERAVPCDETGAPCAPESLEVCASTKRRARRSLLAVDEVSGQRVLARLLRKCVRTGKRTLADRFDTCSVSSAQVLATELIECQETGRRALPDKLERCTATGVLAHPDQFITCAASRRRVLRRVAETCEVSGELAAPGALETCTITGKRALPALLGVNEVTGSKVLKELLVSCERTGRKTLRENLVRSAVSGVEITQDIAVHCELTGAPALPEELAACAATGKRVLPSLLGTCQVSGDKVLEEYLQTCEASGKRVRPDLLQTCSRTGRRVLPQHLGVSRLSGELGVKELLVTCEATRRQVFPDELVLSERSGKRIGRDRAVHCAVSGLVVDVGETEVCSLCRQPACGSEVYEGVCSACLELVGRKQGVAAGLATVAALQRDCDWAGSLRASVHGDTVRVLARRKNFGAFRSPWLVVLRRPGPHGPGAPAPVPASQGEDGDEGDGEHPELEVVQQERVSAETAKTLRRLVREQARLHREHEKEQRRHDPAA
jgi:hypothetical protein